MSAIAGPLVLIGGGKMGSALLAGWLRAGLAPQDAWVVEPDPEKRQALAEEAGRLLVADAPSIFAYTPTNAWLVKPHVRGYSPTAPNQHWPGWWTPLTVDIASPA